MKSGREGGRARAAAQVAAGQAPAGCHLPVPALFQLVRAACQACLLFRMRSFLHGAFKTASEAVLPVHSRSTFKEDGVSAVDTSPWAGRAAGLANEPARAPPLGRRSAPTPAAA